MVTSLHSFFVTGSHISSSKGTLKQSIALEKEDKQEDHLYVFAKRFVNNPALLLLCLFGNVDDDLMLNISAPLLHDLPAHLLLGLHLHLLDHPPAELDRLRLALPLLFNSGCVPAHLLLHITTFVFSHDFLSNTWDVVADPPLPLDKLDPGNLPAHLLAVAPQVARQTDALRPQVASLTRSRWWAVRPRVSRRASAGWPLVVRLARTRPVGDTAALWSWVVWLAESTLRPGNGHCMKLTQGFEVNLGSLVWQGWGVGGSKGAEGAP